jgi:hypothetical protein
MILLHEREHRAARDPWVLASGALLVAVAPWNPALWWALGRVRLAVEGDCDARVLGRGVHPKAYGRLLLEMGSRTRGASPFALALTEGGKTFLERRLLMIPTMFGKRRIWAGLPAMALGALFLVLACETPVPPTLNEEESPPQLSLEGSGSPLVYVDGVRLADPGDLDAIDKNTIESVEVVKGVEAVSAYGDEARNGVIMIFLKKGGALESAEASDEDPDRVDLLTEAKEQAREVEAGRVVIRRRMDAEGGPETKPLIVVDGVIVSDPDFMENLDADNIERIEVIKGEAAEALFGERAANGVIKIFLNK